MADNVREQIRQRELCRLMNVVQCTAFVAGRESLRVQIKFVTVEIVIYFGTFKNPRQPRRIFLKRQQSTRASAAFEIIGKNSRDFEGFGEGKQIDSLNLLKFFECGG